MEAGKKEVQKDAGSFLFCVKLYRIDGAVF